MAIVREPEAVREFFTGYFKGVAETAIALLFTSVVHEKIDRVI